MSLFKKHGNFSRQHPRQSQGAHAVPGRSATLNPMAFALEPRYMFDAAGAATGADIAQQTAADNLVTATPATAADTGRHEVVVVDTSVANYQALLSGMDPNVDVIYLAADAGIDGLAAALAGQSSIDALHVISHGSTGSLNVAGQSLNASNLDASGDALTIIGQALSADGDILLYGCNIGQDGVGQAFIDNLATLTGADIAASDDLTGAAALGGDWDLEAHAGQIESASALFDHAVDAYDRVLALPANGVKELTGSMANGTATLASFISGFTFSNDSGYNLSADGTNGIYVNNTASSASYTVNADTTNLVTFDLTAITFDNFVPASARSFTITGIKAGGNVTTTFSSDGNASFSLGTYTSFTGITGFTVAISGGNVSNITFNDFTIANASASADPTITSATYDASSGNLVVTGTNFAATGGAANDVIANKMTLTGEGGATYTLTDTANVEISSATSFTLALSATDKAALNQMMNTNGTASTGGTTYDVDGAAGFIAASAAISDTGVNGVTVSNVTDPAITSAAYDYNSNVLTVTGTNFVHKSGATNDVDISLLTLTGEGGATYTLTSASDVEITSGTTFSITLAGADIVGVKSLLNKDGTTSATAVTTFNLAAADNWMAGATAANNIADATSGVTVSNYVVPQVTSATYDYSTGALVVTGTNFVSKSGASNDVDISKLVFTGEGGTQYQLTSASDVEVTSATSYTVTLSGADLTNVEGLLNKDGTTSATAGTTFSLVSTEDWMTGSPAANTVADAAATITVSNYAAPAITSATYDYNTNQLVVTGTNFVTLQGATNDIDLSTLTFTGEGGTTYTLTTSTDIDIDSATQFTVTLSGADLVNVETLLNKDGTTSATAGTTYNLAAADNWSFQSPAGLDIADATSGVTVSNYAAPTITSATYDFANGALVVTGTNLVAAGGAANDIVANQFTFTGDAGATYTLTDSSNVDVSSATAFTITLSATDKLAIGGLLNKNGTTSDTGTTYNINAAEDWAAGAPAANTIVDATGNGVTVSNYATPTITSATYDYNTNVLTVTGTNFVNESGATNDVDISLLTFTGEGGATYTITSASDVEVTSATSFAVTLSGADLYNIEALLNKDGATSATSGTTYNLAAADNWMKGAAATTDIADATGNGITVSNFAAPAVTSATYDISTGQLVITGTNFVNKSGATNDLIANLLTLTGEGGTYTLTDTSNVEITSATTLTLTLSATDQLNVNGLLNKNGTASSGATTYNIAAADNWMAGSPAATDIVDATANAITVSNVATPTITDATYDSDTGIVVVTGTNLFKKVGAANDIDLSKLIFTGGAGNDTYTLTTATDVEITSATSFTFTLSGADKTNVDARLDQIGTVSTGGSTYNINGAEDWLTGADTAANIADATNAVTVSINPKVTSATYNAATGTLVVTGTNIQAKTGVTNDITAAKLTLTGEGGSTYTLTDTADVERDSATQFTLTLSATDKAALNQLMNKDGTSSTGATTYNVAVADDWNANVTAGDTSDTTGNAVTVSNVPAPAITSATYNASTGALVLTGTGFTKYTGATNDIDASMLTITGEGGATYALTDTADVEITSGTAATLTLSATDKEQLNRIMNKNGATATAGTTYNVAAAEDWNRGAAAAVNIVDATGNGVTVSNVAVPAITSSTYDASTGTIVVTGTGFLSATGAANDIDVSKLTFTGEGAGADAYTLTSATDVDITSTTSFTLTLSAADKSGVNQIMSKNGATSTAGTTYNLAGAEDWAVGADAAVNVADATATVTVSNVSVPSITSTTYDAATGALVVTGTGFTKASGAANDIDVSKFTFTGEGGTTYTLTSATDVEITSDTAFTITLSGADKLAVNGLLNKDGMASDGGTTYNLAAAEDWTRGADAAVNVVDATSGVTVSNYSAPTITSATFDYSNAQLVVTGTNFVSKSGAANDIDISTLTLTGLGGATYTLTSTTDVEVTSATAFTVTLNGADLLAVKGLLNKDGTASDTVVTTYNLGAADNWMAAAAATPNIADATGNGVTVSNYTAPAITSTTYDISTGILTLTGTNFVSKSGAANDIDVSTFTFTGEGGATYTLTSATDVEITSATSASITLSGADLLAVNGLVNKNGTQADDGATTYNVAAADNWMTAAAATPNIADATNSVTASNYAAPTITSATFDSATGVLTVTGTGFVSKPGAANDVDLSTLTFTGKASGTHTLTTATDVEITSATSFSATLSGGDLTAVKALMDKNGLTAIDATAYNLGGADNWMPGAATSANIADATNAVTLSGIAAPQSGSSVALNITQLAPPPAPPPPPLAAGPSATLPGQAAPPTITPLLTLPPVGQTIGPAPNDAGAGNSFTSGNMASDPGGVDVLSIVGNAVSGRGDLVDSFYGAGRTTSPQSGGNGASDGGLGGGGRSDGPAPSVGGNSVASVLGNDHSVLGTLNRIGAQPQGFGFGGTAGNNLLGGSENGTGGFGGDLRNLGDDGLGLGGDGQGPGNPNRGGTNGEGTNGGNVGPGASLQPTGRIPFQAQMAHARDGISTDMNRLKAAIGEAGSHART